MAFYEVRSRIYDQINGIDYRRGHVVETDQDLWVKRWGDSLVRLDGEISGPHVLKLEKTIEGRVEIIPNVQIIEQEVDALVKPLPARRFVRKTPSEA